MLQPPMEGGEPRLSMLRAISRLARLLAQVADAVLKNHMCNTSHGLERVPPVVCNVFGRWIPLRSARRKGDSHEQAVG